MTGGVASKLRIWFKFIFLTIQNTAKQQKGDIKVSDGQRKSPLPVVTCERGTQYQARKRSEGLELEN